ncbi:MAG TPA: DNA translocase FtsK [Bryobacteraceae bacterium]|jgi:S-DNA-T family DNA segregation ATPase FtsK/SpoIIIE
MKLLGPTERPRLNEAVAVVMLVAGIFLFLALASYHPFDPSLNTASLAVKPVNLTGRLGAFFADVLLQAFGLAAYAFPVLICALGWKWVTSSPVEAPWVKVCGAILLTEASCAALGLIPDWRPISGVIPAGGMLGMVLADFLNATMNLTGAILITAACWIVSLYLVSTFEMAKLAEWFRAPLRMFSGLIARLGAWREEYARRAHMRAQARLLKKNAAAEKAAAKAEARAAGAVAVSNMEVTPTESPLLELAKAVTPTPKARRAAAAAAAAAMSPAAPMAPEIEDIPIRILEAAPPPPEQVFAHPLEPVSAETGREETRRRRAEFRIPPTNLLQEAQGRSEYDTQELKDIAVRIKSKFEEFNVLGSVTQINPGPVVTTFEFKPEAGVKYSRITTLTEDLCLGLQAESILIERIPGKPTVGIEVPNSKREVISLRQILESEEFGGSASPLTVALGKDINGRIKVAALDTMPHMLIAGSTGSGKSVMLNSLIMSILYKATPSQVRLIMVDPKRLEFGLYEGIPHLLTPVITDAKKATYALRNAVLEMERRLKLLASQGVRNIEQYNKKVRQIQAEPRSLFEEESLEEPLEQIPYILILIDELADLMMLERANVEESVTRLAQMARAVGMHLVLATQRPSVDVITGLIKANFPSRISFRVATRVDSRTVLDVMGAEHLLGKGDMLFLPPGSSRLVRVHGSYVSEAETNRVVDFWKEQAAPEYDQTFLIPPPSDEDEEGEEFEGPEDPMYQEAVRVVCEMGKASTSTLQRRLRLGYGRAARILDMMQRDGVIGPPDGSRPRDVLKRPDWLEEIASQVK